MFHCSHGLLCWIKPRFWDFLWKLFSFYTEMISAYFLLGSVLLRGELWKYAKNSNFDNFESALYSTSGSIPLRGNTAPHPKLYCSGSDIMAKPIFLCLQVSSFLPSSVFYFLSHTEYREGYWIQHRAGDSLKSRIPRAKIANSSI